MFGRKKKQDPQTTEEETVESEVLDTEEELDSEMDSEQADDAVAEEQDAAFDRGEGPLDLSEADAVDGANLLDLGSVRIPMIEGMEVRVEVDESTGEPAAVTLVHGEGAVQVRAFACPRSGGLWEEARGDIRAQISRDGGTIQDEPGVFGAEMRAQVTMSDEQGNQLVQPIRFVGVEGPRWMLQGVFLGQGTDPQAADALDGIFRSLVVDRGDAPMPRGQAIPIVLPENIQREAEEAQDED